MFNAFEVNDCISKNCKFDSGNTNQMLNKNDRHQILTNRSAVKENNVRVQVKNNFLAISFSLDL